MIIFAEHKLIAFLNGFELVYLQYLHKFKLVLCASIYDLPSMNNLYSLTDF